MVEVGEYTIDTFIADAQQILAQADGDRERVVTEMTPLVEQVLWDDGLFADRYRAEPENRATTLRVSQCG